MPKYWVVGAMREGKDDQLGKYLRRGYWELSWTDDEKPEMAAKCNQIQTGDRIAVKKMRGGISGEIVIRALGVVIEAEPSEKRVFVRWLLDDLDRVVPGHGCFGSIHGPFEEAEEWTQKVFHI